MDLKQAMDFLASNCPTVFAPIATEIQRLGDEDKKTKASLNSTQNIVNELVMQSMSNK